MMEKEEREEEPTLDLKLETTSVSLAEIDFMKDLRQKGMSYGAIGERVFDKYGFTLDPRDVQKIVHGLFDKKKEKKGA